MNKLQQLYEFMFRLVVKYGVTDENEVFRIAYRYANMIGMINDKDDIKRVVCEIKAIIEQLKEEVRFGGEPFDRVTLEDVKIRRREQGYANNDRYR